MLYRILINLGIFAFGYYLGREVGRVESVREQLRQAREKGGSVYLGEAKVVDTDKAGPQGRRQPSSH